MDLSTLLTTAINALINLPAVDANQAYFSLAVTAQVNFPWPVPNTINESLLQDL